MSRYYSSTRGPKPPIAPKPKLLHNPEEKGGLHTEDSLHHCSNGCLFLSEEELDQENEPEGSQGARGELGEPLQEDGESGDSGDDQAVELQSDSEALCSLYNGAEEEEDGDVEEENPTDPADSEGADPVETQGTCDVECAADPADDGDLAGVECTDDMEVEGCGAGEALADPDGLSEGDPGLYPGEVHPGEESEELGVGRASPPQGPDAAKLPHGDPGDADGEPWHENLVIHLAELNIRDLQCGQSEEEDPSPRRLSPCEESTEEAGDTRSDADNFEAPTQRGECPYDVIGAPCHACEASQDLYIEDTAECPTNGTSVNITDSSSHTYFPKETDDAFEPYSFIDTEPSAEVVRYIVADGENESDCLENKRKQSVISEEFIHSDNNPEPYYISSKDIVDIEESTPLAEEPVLRENPETEGSDRGMSKVVGDKEEVSDYADIDDDSLCQDPEDLQQLGYVSSEDYVEIGDDDDDDEDDSGEKTDKCRKKINIDIECPRKCVDTSSHQLERQPRFRLCSVTMPADVDFGTGYELTDRMVLANTADMFGDDIDFEGHIVPYFEEADRERDNVSDEHVYEEAGLDSEGENFLSLDRKSVVTRSRSLSGKVPGYVPETVPEEPGAEYQTNEYYTVAFDKSSNPLSDSEHLEINRMIPSSKPRRFLFYPRSFSVEGGDVSLSVCNKNDCSLVEDGRAKRNDDNISLPCVIGSSGSFSQRSHLTSSGMSTPTSLVDIPPPFELASITKKPITKSSPSLLIESDSSDKQKKKKSSFKRFLTLKFRRKTENKVHVDVNVSSSRSSSESSHHGPMRLLDMDRRSMNSSPQPVSRSAKPQRSSDSPSTFLFYKDGKRKGAPKTFSSRSGVSRVESFEDRSRPPFMALPLTKPRSISFPNADTSDYENIPAMNSDYENIQIPTRRPVRAGFAEFFDDSTRAMSSTNENDGYVDMSSFTGFESKPSTPQQETESAYTEAYTVCPVSVDPLEEDEVEDDQGRTSEEEEAGQDNSHDRQIDGRSRAFYIAKELVDTEKVHVKALKLLQEDFREAVGSAVREDGEPVLKDERLEEILNQLPEVYNLHCHILTEMESRMEQWEESQRMADVILSRRAEFAVFTPYIARYDRSMALLEDACRSSPGFSSVVRQFELQGPAGTNISLKHQLLQVIIRVLQYRMLLTDYLNNLSPDSTEYEDTQAALSTVSAVADQANENLRQGENLLRLVHIEYSVGGQRDLLQPGRVFVKEGTLMKVSRKCRQPRHLFLMNDVMLYTYPQQDGKYRLKNTLPLTGMKVSKPVLENVQNALKIEVTDIAITLSASSCGERDDWFHALSRTVGDHARGLGVFSSSGEAREKLWMSLGEKAPTLVPLSHVMMCMNCTADFSLTLRRHHCHACGKIVCRGCSRNKYPLKYLKDRMAKVCDHCYAELKKRGGDLAEASGNASPRANRSSRPLSAVFQNIHPPNLWRHRKTTATLTQVTPEAEGATISGTLHRCKRSRRNWKRLWFLIKDKVLYTFSAREDKVASESLPLLGFTVRLPEKPEGEEATNVFQLYHRKTLYYTFRAEDNNTAQRWVNAIEEATVL